MSFRQLAISADYDAGILVVSSIAAQVHHNQILRLLYWQSRITDKIAHYDRV